MVSINGGLLMDPHLTITNPYLKGAAEMYENGVLVTVDLKFIADAHICVFEDTAAFGRYLCFDRVINCNQDALELTRMLLPPSQSPPPVRFLLLLLLIYFYFFFPWERYHFGKWKVKGHLNSLFSICVCSSEDTPTVYQQRISNKKLNKVMVDFDRNLQLH